MNEILNIKDSDLDYLRKAAKTAVDLYYKAKDDVKLYNYIKYQTTDNDKCSNWTKKDKMKLLYLFEIANSLCIDVSEIPDEYCELIDKYHKTFNFLLTYYDEIAEMKYGEVVI